MVKKEQQLVLGCLNFGTKTDEQMSFMLLDEYAELGGQSLDTANNYSFWYDGSRGGTSERVLGKWLAARKKRNNMIVATKIGARPKTIGTGFENVEGLGHTAILKAVDESLLRLRTDYIDILYAHIDDEHTDLNETMNAFDSLVKSGKVRSIGCSNYSLQRIQLANHLAKERALENYTYVQNRYSFLQPIPTADFGVQQCLTEELLAYGEHHPRLQLQAYSPLLNGFYNKKTALPVNYDTPENQHRLTRLKQMADDLNVTPNQVVLAWMLQKKNAVTPVIAVSSIMQLKENMQAAERLLTPEQLVQLA